MFVWHSPSFCQSFAKIVGRFLFVGNCSVLSKSSTDDRCRYSGVVFCVEMSVAPGVAA